MTTLFIAVLSLITILLATIVISTLSTVQFLAYKTPLLLLIVVCVILAVILWL